MKKIVNYVGIITLIIYLIIKTGVINWKYDFILLMISIILLITKKSNSKK